LNGQDSVDCIMTCNGLDGRWIETCYGRDIHTRRGRPWGPHSLCSVGSKSPSQEQGSRGVALTIHPILASKLKKEQSYTSTPPLSLHRVKKPAKRLFM